MRPTSPCRVLLALAVVLVLTGGCGSAERAPQASPSSPPEEGTASTAPEPTTRPEPGPEQSTAPDPEPGTTVRASPVRGIDVSHHQASIEWTTVARSGVSFAYLKATEGSSYVDPTFAQRWRDARAAGLRVGAYHYFTLCSPALPQAEHFLDVLASVPKSADDLPPVIDLELIGNCDPPPERSVLLPAVRAFVDRVEQGTGRRVVLYPHPELEDRYGLVDDVVDDRSRQLWVRRVGGAPPPGPWWMWQRDDAGQVPGIAGPVDIDVLAPGS